MKKDLQDNTFNEEFESGSDLGSDDEDNETEVHSETANGTMKRTKVSNNRHDTKKIKSAKYTKQPTTEELNRLRETENLFNSNFFRLQIDELLREVTVKSKYSSQFEKWLVEFNNFINKLQDESITYDITDRTWLDNSDILFPMIEEPAETKGHFKFMKCSPARVIGSYSYGGNLGPNLSIDLQINMPKEFINKNDYLNERYHRKRALYMCYIATQLKESELVEGLRYKALNGCNSKPVLMFQPAGKLGKHVKVTLHVGTQAESMKCARFHPSRNNVREGWRLRRGEEGDTNPETLLNSPTPHYNSTILSDLVADVNQKFLVKCIENNVNIQQGILLLKVWLTQRNIPQFSGYIMTMFVAYLINIKRINNAMSSYQVIRNVWTALGSSDWDKKGITLMNEEQTAAHPSIFEFHNYFPVVFVDCSGFYNICSYLSLDVYLAVKEESLLAVSYLDGQNFNGFSALFMTPVDFNLKFDHIVRIENTSKLRKKMLKLIDDSEKIDFGPDSYHPIEKYLLGIIRTGLGDRVTLLMSKSLSSDDSIWDCDVDVRHGGHQNKPFVFGIKLNPERAFGTIDKGPQANLPEAEEFRKFWGTKSELRRFQDGSISEACVWQTSPTAESKRLIVKQIICYLLQTKLDLDEKLFYVSDQFEFILQNSKFQPANFEYGTGEEATSRVNSAFDGLMKNLRSLTDTPLEIHSIHGISPVFSFTEVCPPLPYSPISTSGFTTSEKYRLIRDRVKEVRKKNSERVELVAPLHIPSLRVVVQLSQSGKWPDDLEAFKKVKAAFYIQIAEALGDQYQVTAHPWHDYVDVLHDGYIFRVEIAHGKEINLMKKVIDKDGVSKYQDTDESLETEYRLVHLPRLRIALNGLHHQNPCYGPSTCLLKRWLRSHLIDDVHFPDLCVDMLVAHLFLQPAPYQVASQPQVCFWRALSLLASVDWTTQLIVVNFNNDITREKLTEVESNFTSNRSSLPALYFLTPYEGKKPSVWSRHAPSYQMLARVQMLAAEALKFVNLIVFKELSNDVKSLFTPNLEGFHVLIYLQPVMNPLNYLHIDKDQNKPQNRKSKPYEKMESEMFPVLDFDPVQIYLKQLRASYDEFALFFHDSYGGDVIGVLWRPSALEFKEFKTSLVNGRRPITRNGRSGLVADLDAILDGCLILGDGLVNNIEIKINVAV